jgi:hypothetical protein
VGLVFDLPVVALAVVVCGSLVLLAWTLGVTTPRAIERSRADVIVARLRLARAERRLRAFLKGDR